MIMWGEHPLHETTHHKNNMISNGNYVMCVFIHIMRRKKIEQNNWVCKGQTRSSFDYKTFYSKGFNLFFYSCEGKYSFGKCKCGETHTSSDDYDDIYVYYCQLNTDEGNRHWCYLLNQDKCYPINTLESDKKGVITFVCF